MNRRNIVTLTVGLLSSGVAFSQYTQSSQTLLNEYCSSIDLCVAESVVLNSGGASNQVSLVTGVKSSRPNSGDPGAYVTFNVQFNLGAGPIPNSGLTVADPFNSNTSYHFSGAGTPAATYQSPLPSTSPFQPINTPAPASGYGQAAYDKINAALSFVDPGGIIQLAANWATNHSVDSLLTELGQTINIGVASTLSRAIGIINSGLVGALDPQVAQGFSALNNAINDPNSDTRGLLNQNQNRLLRQAMQELDQQSQAPAAPTSVVGDVSSFSTVANPATPTTFDPEISSAFIYKAGVGSPLFTSFIPPAVGDNTGYDIETLTATGWQFAGRVTPLSEFYFATPMSEFQVSGININGLDPNTQWISAIGFASAGQFTGTIERFDSALAVPEPSAFYLMLVGLIGIVFRFGFLKSTCRKDK